MNNRNDIAFKSNITDFQRRGEPNFAWQKVLSMYTLLPGLRGFWPMSLFDSSGNCLDASPNAHTLTYSGNPRYCLDGLAPYLKFGGTDYLIRADEADFDIIGTEGYVNSNLRGLTIGGWFYFETLASPSQSSSASISISASRSISASQSVSKSISKSVSPSISPSPAMETLFTDFWAVTFIVESASLSPSRSVSPSASRSPSVSPSISISKSASVSASVSLSISTSPSASLSVSPSLSQSPSWSPSEYASESPSPSAPFYPSTSMYLISKWFTTGDQRSYNIFMEGGSDNRIKMAVSDLGTFATRVVGIGAEITQPGMWHFIAGRFSPRHISVFVNNDKSSETDKLPPVSLYNSTSSFIIGGVNEGQNFGLVGGASLCFVCATALPDGVIRGLYQHTRALFGL